MTISELLVQLRASPQQIEFSTVIQVISKYYEYTPTAFTNGEISNESGTNEGSCKLFYFAKLNKLNQAETLNLFGAYYREDVLNTPDGSDHGNIRNFMQTGWDKVIYIGVALHPKT